MLSFSMKAFIPYSISDTDAHLVYELGGLLERQGYEVEYNWDQSNSQRVFEEVGGCQFFVGMITHPRHSKQVQQLWQYAMAQGIPAFLLVEQNIVLPGSMSKHKQVHMFRRMMPQNPVRFIELYFEH